VKIAVFRIALALLLAVPIVLQTVKPAEAASVEQRYGSARKAYFELLESPRKQKYRDQWLKVRTLFLEVHAQDPAHQRSADALYMAGKVSQGLYEVSFVKDDLREAVAYFDQLALEHPGSSLADDGLLIAAEILEQKLGDTPRAIDHYRRVMTIYHDGDMHAVARERLEALAPEAIPREPEPKSVADATPGDGTLSGVRYHTYPEFTRVVLDLDQDAEAKPGFVKGDVPRIFIDLTPSTVGDLAQPVQLGDGRVRRVRVGQYRDDVTRVVLDLEAAHPYQVFTLNDPFRVIIDVSGPVTTIEKPEHESVASTPVEPVVIEPSEPQHLEAGSGASPGANVSARAATPSSSASATAAVSASAGQGGAAAARGAELDEKQLADVLETRPPAEASKVQVPESAAGRKLRIVVDPGHGGKDPGAIGPRGVMEKDVTLALAKSLARQLEKSYPCEVILTRDRDVYIPLDERTLIANRLDADLFVSLHANANRSRQPYGVETYYLNFSKNDDVIEVVARENGTSLAKVGDLDMILLDLMANAKINESSRLAAEIQEALVDGLTRKYSHIKDLGVRQGPFHVLWNATMPSVLVEVAFISNHREEQRLTDSNFQNRSAAAIAKGVGNYLEAYNLAAN